MAYFNKTRDSGKEAMKFGLINKNSGGWTTRNNAAYEARGLCSRARTCYDISTNVINGGVEYSVEDPDNLIEGTTAAVSCDAGCTPSLPEVICRAGFWRGPDDTPHRPSCTCQEVIEEEVEEEEEVVEEEVVEEEEQREKKKKKKKKGKKG